MSRAKRERRKQKIELRAYLESIITRLRKLFKTRSVEHFRAAPDARRPCHSCAFNPGTDTWQGFDSTVFGLERAILSGTRFFCHENLPRDPVTNDWLFDPRVAQPCAAYELIKSGPEAAREVVRGMLLDRGDALDDAKADAMLPIFRATLPDVGCRKMAPGVTLADFNGFRLREK